MTQKILVCGDVCGNLRNLYDRVTKLNRKKGPFDFLLCIGNFFGPSPTNWEPYKTGALKIPILTYILGPNSKDHLHYYHDLNGCELCPNVYYLGKRGILSTSGLRIAYLSGIENTDCESVRITEKDAQTVRDIAYKGVEPTEYLGIDVLITSDWPKNVINLAGNVDDDVKKASDDGSELLAWLVSQLKPRYHFAGLKDVFFERQPYRNHQPHGSLNTHCTRFIALSSLTGKKWMYGAVLTPINQIKKDELYQRTCDETDSPYKTATKTVPREEQYFFDMSAGDRDTGSKQRKRKFSQDKCWFCLAGGQDLDTVISIGTEAYVALPKGGLAERHLLVCPVKHLESYLHLSRKAREEVEDLKKSIVEYYERTGEVAVFFERYYRTSHMQLNAVPVLKTCANKLMENFAREAANRGLKIVEMPGEKELHDVLRLDTPYLYVELPDGVKFYIRCERNFPIHFARTVLAGKSILNAKHKVDWKECMLKEEEEQDLAKQLRKEFAEFCQTK